MSPVRAVCSKSMNSEKLEGCEWNGDVVLLTQGDLGLSCCFLYRKRSESSSNSVKYITESLLSSFPFFLFSLLALFIALCLLRLPYPLYLNFFFCLGQAVFPRLPPFVLFAACPSNEQTKAPGEKRLPVSVLGV